MRFSVVLALFAASLATADNVVEFVNQDSTTRTITFTENAGSEGIQPVTLGGLQTQSVTFPEAWVGNWWAKAEGSDLSSGMLGEVAWNGWGGITYFDVSAIVNPEDGNGVKMLYPKSSQSPMSGCQTFPCSNAYNQPDDLQTLSTTESTLVCLVGNKGSQSSRRHARHFVTGHHA
ncbi:MAG: hypothetical protein M1818_002330 [Claussenomyces sp. TS43310]|nr:MAG: hypothetical protein M1818_002330 [Claussenomyces sp. TS43310]